jgi:menaquinol-cytochrome c reductase iron-sulfur subunit
MEPNHKLTSRRKLMSTVIAAMGGLIGTAVGAPAVAYLIGPALQQKTEGWIKLGAVNKVEPGTPTLFKTNIQNQTGWITAEEELSAYVLTEDGQTFAALSNVCTHLGCRVRWIADKNSFYCPCHNGVFNKDGQVVSGPPPRPLDRFESKVENGVLFIRKA